MTDTLDIVEPLRQANEEFAQHYPGETGRRQPVHTVYGGAHLFKSDTAQRLGSLARRSLEQFAPDAASFARALEFTGHVGTLAPMIYHRVTEKLQREPVEDFRIDFEDGYGNRPDAEEDGHAESAAAEVAEGMQERHAAAVHRHSHQAVQRRAARAQHPHARHLCFDTVVEKNGGQLPDNFVVTLPKITIPEQVVGSRRTC